MIEKDLSETEVSPTWIESKENSLWTNRSGHIGKGIVATLLSLKLISPAQAQDLVAWAPSTNNIMEWQMMSHVNQGVPAFIQIMDNGWDGVANIMVKIYDNNGVLQNTLERPNNPNWIVDSWWKVEYYGNSATWGSCTDGAKDGYSIYDEDGNLYDNPDQCVKSAPLPIELVKFVARCEQDGQQVRVVRETASEQDNKGYRVQKSSDGKTWDNIAWVDGAQTAEGTNSYSMIDDAGSREDADGVVYYRLQQQDNDGSTTYSPIEVVSRCGAWYAVELSPNPVRDILQIQISAPDPTIAQQVQLFAADGQPLSPQISAGDPGSVHLDMSDLQQGVYFVRITSGNGDLVIEKVVKQ